MTDAAPALHRLGVVGWPVAHSRSPAMHNAALAALGLPDWHYQRLPVPPELLAETLRALPQQGFVGANVTIPHKEAALAICDEATGTAREIGAANTLTFGADGAITADNTDAPGFLNALPIEPGGRSALVLGAGGSARAVVWALREAGAEVAVWNRTPDRAAALAADLGVRATAAPVTADLLVNCTSVGLAGEALDALPVDADRIAGFAAVVDLVYHGEGTALVAAARAARVPVADGLEVLVQQGALSLSGWTGRDAPLDVMRRAAGA